MIRSGLMLGVVAAACLAAALPAAAAEDPSELCERAILNGARRGGATVGVERQRGTSFVAVGDFRLPYLAGRKRRGLALANRNDGLIGIIEGID